jgi:hypothetical protein
MIVARFDQDKSFAKEMNNIVNYSLGFIEGANKGKAAFFATLGERVKVVLEQFIDSSARQSPETLHHVYEWHRTGSPEARLFDIQFSVSNLGLSLKSTFTQSTSTQNGSNVPFYNKASVMESGMSVTIKPRKAQALVFESGTETVFTKNPVNVSNPGGVAVVGSYEKTFDLFINSYFTQAFLQSSGIIKRFKDTSLYKKNLRSGVKLGRQVGVVTGLRWIVNVGVGA